VSHYGVFVPHPSEPWARFVPYEGTTQDEQLILALWEKLNILESEDLCLSTKNSTTY